MRIIDLPWLSRYGAGCSADGSDTEITTAFRAEHARTMTRRADRAIRPAWAHTSGATLRECVPAL
jgi:hypothetical protein